MTASEQGFGDESKLNLIDKLSGLSGKYGTIERKVNGTLITNDEGYVDVIPALKRSLSGKQGGLAVVVGSGGLLSLLPDLPVDTAIVLDINPAVLELNGVLAQLVQNSSSPNEVSQRLVDPDFQKQHQILSDLAGMYPHLDMLRAFLTKEAREYGEYHWSNPIRFNQVKESLKRKPITYIAADITDNNFGTAFDRVVQDCSEKITFANFTNVHDWIMPKSMAFLRGWPFDPDASILYADFKGRVVGDWPGAHLVEGLDKYLSSVKTE
jgi:hypothetical protein